MTKRFSLLAVLVLLVILSSFSVHAQEKVVINWFVGLGTGDSIEQQEAQNQVVADFNASQDAIELQITVVLFATAKDTLSTLIAAGNTPDIIGPVGVGGSNAYLDLWADLQPLVDSTGYDLSGFDPALVDLYRTADGELLGIPFATFPTVVYYSRDLFDEAGLNYPPSEFDAPYVMPDGTEVEWNYETVAEIAKILTVDANGNDATMEGFDPENIVQFGFDFSYDGLRLMWTDFQPEDFYDETANSITIPDSWRTGTEWLQDGVWGSSFMPNKTYSDSEYLQNGNPFASGHVAMSITPLWYTCCLNNSIDLFEWDLAVVPRSFDGEYHVATDADTFRMTKQSQHPEEAFAVISYLMDQAVPVLAPTYGAYPARPEYQQTYIDVKSAQYPWDVNWGVALASLAYNNPGVMHHEAYTPNWTKMNDRIETFSTLLKAETGGTIDVQAELDLLETDLNAIINE
jgi:multiple sugar transport system substrate-binding protein